MNSTDKIQNKSGSARPHTHDTHRARALAIALVGLFALPAAAGDANAPTAPSMRAVTPGGTNLPKRTERFRFTGVYRFSTPQTPRTGFPLPRLTTGSLPPAPIKPNDPPTGTLGGPSPANAAVSIPSKSQAPLADPLNPRVLDQSHGNDDQTAAGRLQRVSRASIAPASPARLSDPLPELAPSPQRVSVTKDVPSDTTSKTARRKSAKTTRHRRPSRYKTTDGRPEKLPKWWYNAWHADD